MALVRELVPGSKWEVTGADRHETLSAVAAALDNRTPILRSGLPMPMAYMVRAAVGLWTSDRVDTRAGTVSKVHHLGDGFYNTTFQVTEGKSSVVIERNTQGVLAAGAKLGDFGGAFQFHLDQLRRSRR